MPAPADAALFLASSNPLPMPVISASIRTTRVGPDTVSPPPACHLGVMRGDRLRLGFHQPDHCGEIRVGHVVDLGGRQPPESAKPRAGVGDLPFVGFSSATSTSYACSQSDAGSRSG